MRHGVEWNATRQAGPGDFVPVVLLSCEDGDVVVLGAALLTCVGGVTSFDNHAEGKDATLFASSGIRLRVALLDVRPELRTGEAGRLMVGRVIRTDVRVMHVLSLHCGSEC